MIGELVSTNKNRELRIGDVLHYHYEREVEEDFCIVYNIDETDEYGKFAYVQWALHPDDYAFRIGTDVLLKYAQYYTLIYEAT